MPRKKRENKKSAPIAVDTDGGINKDNRLPLSNDNKNLLINQEIFENSSIDNSEILLFRDNPNDYEEPENNKIKGRHFLFIVYEDSAGSFEEWTERLENTGLQFVVSPYHDKDVNPDGSPKKPHWHVIVSYSNTTTYNNVKGLREVTKGPFPIKCNSVSGTYAYFTHKHNPEKYQYDEKDIKCFNGWEKALESHEVSAIMNELTSMVFVEDIREYAELIVMTEFMNGDYKSVAMSHTLYLDRLITSYRNNPVRILSRYVNSIDSTTDGNIDLREMLIERIEMLIKEQEKQEKSKKYKE